MPKTPRQQLSAWMRQRVADMDEVNLPDLAKRAVAAHRDDAEFLRAWFDDTAYAVAYTLATQIAADTRKPAIREEDAAPAAPSRRPAEGWFERLEHLGARYLRLGDMTRQDLLDFAVEREGPALTELRLVGLARKLAGKMADDGKKVREVFSEEEIDRWDRLLKVKVSVSVPVPAKLKTASEEAAD